MRRLRSRAPRRARPDPRPLRPGDRRDRRRASASSSTAGRAYAQRRAEQSVADLASMAGATAYLNTQGDIAGEVRRGRRGGAVVATANGYTDGVEDAVVDDRRRRPSSARNRPRQRPRQAPRNNFASVLGMPTWDVSSRPPPRPATAPNGAIGAMPLLFNAEAFPGAMCDETAGTCAPEVYQLPGTGNQDVPQDATQFNWTIFCTGQRQPVQRQLGRRPRHHQRRRQRRRRSIVNDDIGPLNAGAHTTLFTALEAHVGGVFPVPIVNDARRDGRLGLLQAPVRRRRRVRRSSAAISSRPINASPARRLADRRQRLAEHRRLRPRARRLRDGPQGPHHRPSVTLSWVSAAPFAPTPSVGLSRTH